MAAAAEQRRQHVAVTCRDATGADEYIGGGECAIESGFERLERVGGDAQVYGSRGLGGGED